MLKKMSECTDLNLNKKRKTEFNVHINLESEIFLEPIAKFLRSIDDEDIKELNDCSSWAYDLAQIIEQK